MKKWTIRTQLAISFVTITVLIIGSLSFLTLNLLNNHFSKYVNERQEDRLQQYVKTIEEDFEENGEIWTEYELSKLSNQALESDFYFSIKDTKQEVIWQLEGNQLKSAQKQLKKKALQIAKNKSVTFKQLKHVSKTLTSNNKSFGTIIFYYMGPFAYTEHDAMFISRMKKSLVYVALVALVISLLLASNLSKRIGKPLKHISEFTHQLTRGNYASIVSKETPVAEINSLIDSLNQLSDQLDRQTALRKRLTTDISHELRTPLTTLKGTVEGMIDGVWEITPGRLQSYYDEIDRLTRLIANIELIDKIEANDTQLEKSVFNMRLLLDSVVQIFANNVNQQQLTVSVQGDEAIIFADKDKLNQVWTNLLSNAIKFTPKKGKIHIRLKRQSNLFVMSIEDNGIGIENTQQRHIFDRFYMADSSRSRKMGGQGIGLSIVKSVIEAHNGRIVVQSKLSEGTKFTITIPIGI